MVRQMEMEERLSQSEIDELFEAARASTVPAAGTNDVIVPYNFASVGQISKDQLRAISVLNDLFARNLTHNLAAWLRSRLQVNLVSGEQMPFNEFLLRVPEINYLSSIRLEPLGALALLQLDMSLAPPIVDLLLGGEGREGHSRELTDIEESILGSAVEIICRELTEAWQPVGLRFNFERRQMQTQAAHIMSVNEKALCLGFEIRMSHATGLLNLAFPAVVANTILRRLTSDWSRRGHHGRDVRMRIEGLARQIRFGGVLQLPSVRLPATTIEDLEPGTVLRLGLPASAPAEWRVGGQCIRQAHAVRQGERRAARILERMTKGDA
jgi:flagellar motor switch protein FliM